MFALQASIGALNDLVDAPADRVAKPSKPIPAGLVAGWAAVTMVLLGFSAGIALAAASGPVVTAIALAGVGSGYAYDLRLKGTAWGPLAFAVGVPLLPAFAWYGASGTLPAPFGILLPAGALAGLGLALANGIGDEEDDREAGTATAAGRLGRPTAWLLHVAALGAALTLAAIGLVLFEASGPGVIVAAGGGGVVGLGAVATGTGRRSVRRHGWEVEAVGIGVVAAGWVVAVGIGG